MSHPAFTSQPQSITAKGFCCDSFFFFLPGVCSQLFCGLLNMRTMNIYLFVSDFNNAGITGEYFSTTILND